MLFLKKKPNQHCEQHVEVTIAELEESKNVVDNLRLFLIENRSSMMFQSYSIDSFFKEVFFFKQEDHYEKKPHLTIAPVCRNGSKTHADVREAASRGLCSAASGPAREGFGGRGGETSA